MVGDLALVAAIVVGDQALVVIKPEISTEPSQDVLSALVRLTLSNNTIIFLCFCSDHLFGSRQLLLDLSFGLMMLIRRDE